MRTNMRMRMTQHVSAQHARHAQHAQHAEHLQQEQEYKNNQ